MTICTLELNAEDKTGGSQILSHVYTVEEKATSIQFSGVRLQQLQRQNLDVGPCSFILSQPIPTLWPHHGRVHWEHMAHQSREQPFCLAVALTRHGNYQHLQLLIPSKLWIETLVWKEPNPSIFRNFQSCAETVLFSGVSFPRYSAPKKLADPSHI